MGAGNVVAVWTGVPTTTDMVASLKLSSAPAGSLYLAVSTDVNMAPGNCLYFGPLATTADVTATYASGVVLGLIGTGLAPNTTHYYALRVDNTVYTGKKATFKTLAAVGSPMSFEFGAASCAERLHPLSQSALAKYISGHNPLFYVGLGDFPYIDDSGIEVTTDALFSARRDEFGSIIDASLRQLPFEYLYSDHDYGKTDGDGTAACRNAGIANARKRIPMRGMRSSTVTDDIGHSFVVGRVRFIMCDTRSNTAPRAGADSSAKQYLGAAQKAWVKSEFAAAKAAGQVVCWAMDTIWHGTPNFGADCWQCVPTERQEMANYIKWLGMSASTFIIAGDAHMLAFQDRTTGLANYATGAGGDLYVCQAAPIKGVSVFLNGGPWTVGPIGITNASSVCQQYGGFTVTDTGTSTISVQFRGYSYDGTGDVEALQLDQTMTLSVPPVAFVDPGYPVPRQAAHTFGSVGGAVDVVLTREIVFGMPPQAGNLLLLFISPDKSVTSVTPPAGFTLVTGNLTNTNSLGALYSKIADGTETVLTFLVDQAATTNSAGDFSVCMEIAGKTAIDQAVTSSPNTTSLTNTATTGTLASSDEYAFAFWSIDAESSRSTSLAFNNTFTTLFDFPLNNDFANATGTTAVVGAVGCKTISGSTAAVSVTATHAPTSDETTLILVTLK